MAAGDVALQTVEGTVDSHTLDTVVVTATANHSLIGAYVHYAPPEVSLVGTTVGALGATITLQFSVAGPGGSQTYPVTIHATEIDTSA